MIKHKYIKAQIDIDDYRGYYIERHTSSDGDSYIIYDSIDDSKVGMAFSLEQAHNLIDSWEDGTIGLSENLNLDILRKQQGLYNSVIEHFADYASIDTRKIDENGIIHTQYTTKPTKNNDVGFVKITRNYLDALIESFNLHSEASDYNIRVDYKIRPGNVFRLVKDMLPYGSN